MQSTLGQRVLFIACIALCISCKNSSVAPADLKKGYFPLKLHTRVIFQVDSIVYNAFTNTSTQYNFELKDSVVSQMVEADRTAFIINRYKRVAGQGWAFQKSIARSVVEQRAEEFIDNIRYVRLVFPPSADKAWNGNTYNNLGQQIYHFAEIDVSQAINGIQFDSTAVVKQVEEINLVREDTATEVYAKNIGLVKKEVKAVDKNISTGKITGGYQYLMVVKSIL